MKIQIIFNKHINIFKLSQRVAIIINLLLSKLLLYYQHIYTQSNKSNATGQRPAIGIVIHTEPILIFSIICQEHEQWGVSIIVSIESFVFTVITKEAVTVGLT